jgi:hypothetical protein
LAWNLFITNAPPPRLGFAQAAKLYQLRWRIEIIFKSWKSHLGLAQLTTVGPRQIEPLLYALLILAVLLHASGARPPDSDAGPPARPLSLLRLAELFARFTPVVLLAQLPPLHLLAALHRQIHAHCRYDTRARRSYAQIKCTSLS